VTERWFWWLLRDPSVILPPQNVMLNLSEAIRRDLEHIGVTTVGGLLISGDLTWRAARDEFEWAAKFITSDRGGSETARTLPKFHVKPIWTGKNAHELPR
jgi:hypothetical protein